MADISISENVRHGKPVIEGTRITVGEVLEMLESGMDFGEIEEEYDLNREQIKTAVKFARSKIEEPGTPA